MGIVDSAPVADRLRVAEPLGGLGLDPQCIAAEAHSLELAIGDVAPGGPCRDGECDGGIGKCDEASAEGGIAGPEVVADAVRPLLSFKATRTP